MGKNFYLVEPSVACLRCGRGLTDLVCGVEPCPACGGDYARLHIGKSSAGWAFALHVIPEEGLNSLDDWRARWSLPGARIVSEDGEGVSFEEMERVITERRGPRTRWSDYALARNHAQRGPNGTIRCVVDGVHCVGHGGGTWDLIAGDFS